MPIPSLDVWGGGVEGLPTSQKRRQRETRLFFLLTAIGLAGVVCFFYNAPPLTGKSCEGMTIWWVMVHGREPEAVENALRCAQEYQQRHQGFLLLGFALTYITFQSFAIPGGMCCC